MASLASVCVTGAESTGKSELAAALAQRFSAPVVEEYAREYAIKVGRPLNFFDVAPIARGQIAIEDRMFQSETGLVILDTDLLSTVAYSRYYWGSCPDWIELKARERRAALYLFLDVDVPWIADPARDPDANRDRCHDVFRRVLDEFGARYVLISGSWDERRRRAIATVQAAL